MRTPLVVSIALGVFVACTTPTSVCGCSPREPVAIVFGRIWVSGDRPLGGALIRASRTAGPCPGRGAAFDGGFGETSSDSSGYYRRLVAGGGDSVCVQMIAYRSVSARMDSLVSSSKTLSLRIGTLQDSTQIDFRFP